MTKWQEDEEKERYGKGLISLREYYTKRKELAENQGQAEAMALRAEDGLVYRETERSTIANDFYVMKQMRAAGLDAMKPSGETADGFADRILSAVIENGVPFALLGGLLLPEGVADEQWTSNHAEATAARLAGATSQ